MATLAHLGRDMRAELWGRFGRTTLAKILIVEDNFDFRRNLEKWLRLRGHTGVAAESVEQALLVLEEEKPELVILDLLMPDADGYVLLEELRADPAYVHLPVVVVTAQSAPSHRERVLQSGAQAFFEKPVRWREMSATIERLLASGAGGEGRQPAT
jgi:DNA-binding response OmpR family regulator